MNGITANVYLETILNVGHAFYHFVLMKLLDLILIWCVGSFMLLKPPWARFDEPSKKLTLIYKTTPSIEFVII
jgi:hypothetical protein